MIIDRTLIFNYSSKFSNSFSLSCWLTGGVDYNTVISGLYNQHLGRYNTRDFKNCIWRHDRYNTTRFKKITQGYRRYSLINRIFQDELLKRVEIKNIWVSLFNDWQIPNGVVRTCQFWHYVQAQIRVSKVTKAINHSSVKPALRFLY